MKVILFGATGMVGQGVLRECLLDPDVGTVLAVGRTPTGQSHPKLQEIVQQDMWNLNGVGEKLAAYDACFFCLGVSAAGMKAADYERLTYDLTLSVAGALLEREELLNCGSAILAGRIVPMSRRDQRAR